MHVYPVSVVISQKDYELIQADNAVQLASRRYFVLVLKKNSGFITIEIETVNTSVDISHNFL